MFVISLTQKLKNIKNLHEYGHLSFNNVSIRINNNNNTHIAIIF